MATITKQTVRTGATILLKINGAVVGRAQSLDPRVSYGTEGVYEIGTIMPVEHVHQRYEGSIGLERYLMKKEDLIRAGVVDINEGILQKDIIDIEVIEKDTGNTITVYRGCTFSEYTTSYRANAIAGENATVMFLSADLGE